MAQDPAKQPARGITCREVAEWTSAYLDAHVDDAIRVRMALHLAVCAGCKTYVKQMASVRRLLGILPTLSQGPAQKDRLRQAFSMAHSMRLNS